MVARRPGVVATWRSGAPRGSGHSRGHGPAVDSGAGECAPLSSSLGSVRGCEARAATRRPGEAFSQRGGAAVRAGPGAAPQQAGAVV